MTCQEKVKYLWEEGEFKRAYDLSQKPEIKNLIDWAEKSGGIGNVPLSTVYNLIMEDSYLYNQMQELSLQDTKSKKKGKKKI